MTGCNYFQANIKDKTHTRSGAYRDIIALYHRRAIFRLIREFIKILLNATVRFLYKNLESSIISESIARKNSAENRIYTYKNVAPR